MDNDTLKAKLTAKLRLENILSDFENADINESDILELKNKFKEIEKKVKENNKPKTITISAKDHNVIKKHCALFGLNIGDWASKILLKEISDNTCVTLEEKTTEEVQEESIKLIKDNYTRSVNRKKNLIKTNKIIVNNHFKFEGYSIIDSKPIYEFVGDMTYFKVQYNLDSMGIEMQLVGKTEISLNIFSNLELEVETF